MRNGETATEKLLIELIRIGAGRNYDSIEGTRPLTRYPQFDWELIIIEF